jgi:hypothetical protein
MQVLSSIYPDIGHQQPGSVQLTRETTTSRRLA